MELSRDFSQKTLNLLNGVTFSELDAAEKRLLLTGYQAGLMANMTPQERGVIAYLEEHASAIRRTGEASEVTP